MSNPDPRLRGRPARTGEPAEKRVTFRLDDDELAELDRRRGTVDRSTFVRRALLLATTSAES